MKLDLVYFAWVRERIGEASEVIETNAATVEELITELKAREDRYALALSDVSVLRFAVDQELVSNLMTPITGAREVAIFPPMTGG